MFAQHCWFRLPRLGILSDFVLLFTIGFAASLLWDNSWLMTKTKQDLWVRTFLSLIFLSIYGTIIYVFVDYFLEYRRFYWEVFIGSFIFLYLFILIFPWRILKTREQR